MAEGYHGHQYSDENQKAAFEFLDHFNRLPQRDTRSLRPKIWMRKPCSARAPAR